VTNEQFEALVARLEESARRDPKSYRLRVAALALAGYGYLVLVVAFLVASMIAALASLVYLKALGVKIAIGIGIFLALVIKAIWVKLDAPTGIEVTANDAPGLMGLVDALRRQLRAPAFHHVLVTSEFNASVVQVPRLGVFGWHRNYLTIGLPLMKCLTPDQLSAVLAHEFGHLAGGHGSFSNWIYRLRIGWYRLLDVLESEERFGTFLFKPFFMRFAPYFNAYSFPLARANEYEADAAAARAVSRRAAAEALTNLEVLGSYLGERYWPGIHRKAIELPRPAFAPFAAMGERFASGIDSNEARGWLEQALARETTVANTHPSLPDRLKSLGEEPRLAPPSPGQAADQLLGAALGPITEAFDREWTEGILPAWEERFQAAKQGRARLAELSSRDPAACSILELIELGQLVEDIEGDDDRAQEAYRLAHQRDGSHVAANLVLGRCLLARGDDAGMAMLEFALAADADRSIAITQMLRDHHWAKGRQEEARAWNEKREAALERHAADRRERDFLRRGDKLEDHGLDAATMEAIRESLRAIPGLRKAYLARKRLEIRPERPLFVLGFTATPWWRWQDRKASAEAQHAILETVPIPGEWMVVSLEGENSSFAGKFRRRWRVA
jgi:Zn-dependent protease with chaperone function